MNSPKTRDEIVEIDKRCIWHPYTPMEQYRAEARPLVIDHAEGSRIVDLDGRSIIDGNASWWTSLLGHNHPRLVRRLVEQSKRLCHTSLAGITHRPAAEFAEAIVKVAPKGMTQVFFSDNGSTAVEVAMKLALQYWSQGGAKYPKKRRFLSLNQAFHGETLGVTALGGVEAFVAPFSFFGGMVTHLPSPAEGEEEALFALRNELEKHSEQIAGFVVEPLIQGVAGMLMYSPEYLKEARALCDEYDVLFILDEVFTGYGRTGRFWASDYAGICPDILCTAKGLSGGMLPFAATLVTPRIFEAFLGVPERAFYYGHTYCGNPLGASIAAEVLSIYEDERIVENTAAPAKMIADTFSRLGQLEGVESSRSLGVCGALTLRGGGGYLEKGGWEVYERALERGAYLRPLGNVVYVTPALNIPESDLRELLGVLEECVTMVAGQHAETRAKKKD